MDVSAWIIWHFHTVAGTQLEMSACPRPLLWPLFPLIVHFLLCDWVRMHICASVTLLCPVSKVTAEYKVRCYARLGRTSMIIAFCSLHCFCFSRDNLAVSWLWAAFLTHHFIKFGSFLSASSSIKFPSHITVQVTEEKMIQEVLSSKQSKLSRQWSLLNLYYVRRKRASVAYRSWMWITVPRHICTRSLFLWAAALLRALSRDAHSRSLCLYLQWRYNFHLLHQFSASWDLWSDPGLEQRPQQGGFAF